jgi:phosphoglycerate dehydrogenase-like enzyme
MLHESTLGIVGLGEIGREIALRAKGFGMRTLYHQRSRAPQAEERELGVRYVPLQTLMAESDWIVPQVPTAPSTRDLIGRAELANVKHGACIVNVANPQVINRDAAIEALRDGRLGGFALDTQYQEPLPADDELLRLPNVILTPRMAGSPRSNGLKDFEQLITTLAREIAS